MDDRIDFAIETSNVEALKEMLTVPMENPLMIRCLSALCAMDPQHGIQYMERALNIDPVHPVILNNLGYLYHHQLRNFDAAIKYYRQCLDSDPRCRIVYLGLSDLYHSLRLLGPEVALLRQGLREFPADPELWNQFGVCQMSESGNVAYLRSIFDEAERHTSEPRLLSKICINKGHLENQLGNFPQSIHFYTRALELDPSNHIAVHNVLLNVHYLPELCPELINLCNLVGCPRSSTVHDTIRALHFCMVEKMGEKKQRNQTETKSKLKTLGFNYWSIQDCIKGNQSDLLLKAICKGCIKPEYIHGFRYGPAWAQELVVDSPVVFRSLWSY